MSRKQRRNNSRQSKDGRSGRHDFHPRPQAHHTRSGHSPDSIELVGVVQANEKGFGFFVPEDGSQDAFVPPREMDGVLNGDTIRARVSPDPRKEGKRIAAFVGVVKRAHSTMVGSLFKEHGHFYLKPDDTRVTRPVLLKGDMPGQAGQKAVAKILKWPGRGDGMEGQVVEILGMPDEPGVDIKTIIRKYQWPETFPKPVESQARALPEDPTPADWKDRLDLRNIPILTIDGADAKDFDDAISLQKESGGRYRLGVHIADVSHYVREGTPLDTEAQARATSVYLADRVLPMLPHTLSDGLCSLKEGVPRLTVSAFLTYDAGGRLLKTEFAQSVIQSGRRGIYEDVQKVLDGLAPPEVWAKYRVYESMLMDMVKLSQLIRKARRAQGSLDFDFPEVRAVMDSTGTVLNVHKKDRLETHRLIEDFMVAANEAVASHLDRLKIPTIYRIHEPPNAEDLEELIAFLQAYHISHKKFDLGTPLGLQSLLTSLEGSSFVPVVSNLVLRSLKLAVYSTRNAGHFGLALDSYCHFTSPIRRYPDLVVHRSLKQAMAREKAGARSHAYEKTALHCSLQERVSEKAERESQKVMQLRFMENKVGQSYQGLVRHLTPHGIYVELDPYGIEGFLPLESLTDDRYELDTTALVFRGKRGGKIQLGDIVQVKVLGVDMVFQKMTLAKL